MAYPTLYMYKTYVLHSSLYSYTAKLFSKQWRQPDSSGQKLPTLEFHIPEESTAFADYYDRIQDNLESLAGMDEFIAGNA